MASIEPCADVFHKFLYKKTKFLVVLKLSDFWKSSNFLFYKTKSFGIVSLAPEHFKTSANKLSWCLCCKILLDWLHFLVCFLLYDKKNFTDSFIWFFFVSIDFHISFVNSIQDIWRAFNFKLLSGNRTWASRIRSRILKCWLCSYAICFSSQSLCHHLSKAQNLFCIVSAWHWGHKKVSEMLCSLLFFM